jgi:hypothetical protein
MGTGKRVQVIPQPVAPGAIKVAGFTFLKQLAVAKMSEQTIGIGEVREPLAASGQDPIEDGSRLAHTGRGGRHIDELKGRKLGE